MMHFRLRRWKKVTWCSDLLPASRSQKRKGNSFSGEPSARNTALLFPASPTLFLKKHSAPQPSLILLLRIIQWFPITCLIKVQLLGIPFRHGAVNCLSGLIFHRFKPPHPTFDLTVCPALPGLAFPGDVSLLVAQTVSGGSLFPFSPSAGS